MHSKHSANETRMILQLARVSNPSPSFIYGPTKDKDAFKCPFCQICLLDQGRSQGGGAQGARAPPLSCRAMTAYERRLTTHVVTLASC